MAHTVKATGLNAERQKPLWVRIVDYTWIPWFAFIYCFMVLVEPGSAYLAGVDLFGRQWFLFLLWWFPFGMGFLMYHSVRAARDEERGQLDEARADRILSGHKAFVVVWSVIFYLPMVATWAFL